ncbi:hypothetical protein QR685DRAFT_451644 [Neurospora intermedia]|uniref:Uncharacterized protein n=1 Tax=Neurospora intermedia TaxID=5142 RepID=A0ABR3D156_NEUIN
MEFSEDNTSPQQESFQPKYMEEKAMEEGPAVESSEDNHLQEDAFSPAPEDEIYMEDWPVVERAPAVMEETTVMEKELEPSVTEWLPIAEGSPIVEGSPTLEGEGSPNVEWSPISEKESVLKEETVEERASSPSIETPYFRIDTPAITEQASRVIEKAPVLEEPYVAEKPPVVEKPSVQPVVEKMPSLGKTHATEEKHIVSKKPAVEKNHAPAEKKAPIVEKTPFVPNTPSHIAGKALLIEKMSVMKETPFVNKVHVPIMQKVKVPVVLKTTVSKMTPLVEKFRKEIRALQNYQEVPSAAEPAAAISVLFLFALYTTLFTLIFRLNASSVLLFLPLL